MQRTIILAGAPIENLQWAKKQIKGDDYIICADGGAHHAKEMGVVPDLVIGDFDSICPDLLRFYQQHDTVEARCDPDQYSTDFMKALSRVREGDEVVVMGAMGARADHDFSNYLILSDLKQSNHIALLSDKEERRILQSDFKFSGEVGQKIGIFPLRTIHNLHFEGLEYAAEDMTGPYEFGWNGACNVLKAKTAEIQMDTGAALFIRTYNPD